MSIRADWGLCECLLRADIDDLVVLCFGELRFRGANLFLGMFSQDWAGRRRRLLASGSDCPVIFMTAIDDDATRKEAIHAGCVAYLKKPFTPHLLLDALGKAVT
jgi:DNA-binding NarL/FixJ family response regulator